MHRLRRHLVRRLLRTYVGSVLEFEQPDYTRSGAARARASMWPGGGVCYYHDVQSALSHNSEMVFIVLTTFPIAPILPRHHC